MSRNPVSFTLHSSQVLGSPDGYATDVRGEKKLVKSWTKGTQKVVKIRGPREYTKWIRGVFYLPIFRAIRAILNMECNNRVVASLIKGGGVIARSNGEWVL